MRVKVEMNSKGEVKAHRIEIPIQGGGGELGQHAVAGLVSLISSLSVTLCWDNLEALCQDCHNKEHHKQERHKRYRFDENGGILPPYQKNN